MAEWKGYFMRKTGVIVTFDDREYSEEETIFLYQRFFEVLGRIADAFLHLI